MSTSQQTYILFEDGHSVEVNLSLYAAPKGSNRPIDAYLVTECEGDFTRAARRAAETVYNKLQTTQDLEPQVVGFDLHGLEAGQSITGGSGGLAFAIALAKKLYSGKDIGPVAATGEIQSSRGGGVINPVKGITAKLLAASQRVPENGWVFYPKENEKEVPEGLKKVCRKKGINLYAVATVNEALDLLFGMQEAQTGGAAGKTNKTIYLLMVFLIIAATGLILFFNRPREQENLSTDTQETKAGAIIPKQETPSGAKNDYQNVGNKGFE